MSEIKVVLGLLPSLQIIIGKEEGGLIKDCARIISIAGKIIPAPLYMEFDKKREKTGKNLSKDLFIDFDEPASDIRECYMKYISKIAIAGKKFHVPEHMMN